MGNAHGRSGCFTCSKMGELRMEIGRPIRKHTVIPITEPITAPEPVTPKPKPSIAPVKKPERIPEKIE